MVDFGRGDFLAGHTNSRSNNMNEEEKIDVLHKLWDAARQATFFASRPRMTPSFNEAEAAEAVHGYIDYFCGRMIKADFRDLQHGNVSVFSAYDGDFGDGAAKCALGW